MSYLGSYQSPWNVVKPSENKAQSKKARKCGGRDKRGVWKGLFEMVSFEQKLENEEEEVLQDQSQKKGKEGVCAGIHYKQEFSKANISSSFSLLGLCRQLKL